MMTTRTDSGIIDEPQSSPIDMMIDFQEENTIHDINDTSHHDIMNGTVHCCESRSKDSSVDLNRINKTTKNIIIANSIANSKIVKNFH